LEPSFSEKLTWIHSKITSGYTLDHVSLYSCDAHQLPQSSPQHTNQAVHDYAVLLSVLKVGGGLKPDSLSARGLAWGSLTDDT